MHVSKAMLVLQLVLAMTKVTQTGQVRQVHALRRVGVLVLMNWNQAMCMRTPSGS